MVPCGVCGNPVYRPPSKPTRQFCSPACQYTARRGKPSNRAPTAKYSLGVVGFREDIGHYVRSRWEANYARYLNAMGVPYQYEPNRFTIPLPDGTAHTYTPDFLVDGAYYVEIKGWMRADRRQAEIIEAARTIMPVPLILLQNDEYRSIERTFAAGIVGWEYDGDPAPELPKRYCLICGKLVTSIFRKTVLCSRQCGGVAKRLPKGTRACATCGNNFQFAAWEANKKFCNRVCKDASQIGRSHLKGSKRTDEQRTRMSEGHRRSHAAKKATAST